MPRRARNALGGSVFHVLNRAAGRENLFRSEGDYLAFRRTLAEAGRRLPMRLLAYCLMPNHWHLVVWPRGDGDLSEYMRWLTVTHTQRWHAAHGTSGMGPLYQGRFKSFPVQEDDHFITVCRYVERNPLRAGLVDRAEAWPWSSLSSRSGAPPTTAKNGGGNASGNGSDLPLIAEWPVDRPRQWLAFVNRAQTEAEQDAIRHAIVRGSPYGSAAWQARTADGMHLQSTLRGRGRPRKSRTSTKAAAAASASGRASRSEAEG